MPERAADSHEEAALQRLELRNAVGQLEERDRELVALRFGADLSAKQIAARSRPEDERRRGRAPPRARTPAPRNRAGRSVLRRVSRSEAGGVKMNGTVAVPAARSRQIVTALPELVFFGGAVAVTAGLAAANGGFFPTSWGWSALALFFVAAVAVIVRTDVRLGRLELGFLGLVTLLVGWTLLSSIWSIDLSASFLEAQRGLVLIGVVVAVLCARPGPTRPAAARRRRRCRDDRLWLRARDSALPGTCRHLRHGCRLPAQHSRRLLERARRLRGDRGGDRARLRGPGNPNGRRAASPRRACSCSCRRCTSPSAAARGSLSSPGSSS